MKVFLIIDARNGGISGAFKKRDRAEKYLNGAAGYIIKKIKVEK